MAAIAIVIVVLVIGLSILFNDSDLSLSERIGLFTTIVVFSLPGILYSLFQLTCLANNKQSSACSVYGWIISALIIFICVVIVFAALSSMLTYNTAVAKTEPKIVVSDEEADQMAQDIMQETPDIKEEMSYNDMKKFPVVGGVMDTPVMSHYPINGSGAEFFANKKPSSGKKANRNPPPPPPVDMEPDMDMSSPNMDELPENINIENFIGGGEYAPVEWQGM